MVSSNQMHGRTFENLIKGSAGIFSYSSSDRNRLPGERSDIAGFDDHQMTCTVYQTQPY